MAFVLTSVSLVLHAQRYDDALHELGPLLSSFLGPSPNLSLGGACTFECVRLLDWVWTLSCTSVAQRPRGWSITNFLRSEPQYHTWQFWKCTKTAAERGAVDVLEWLFRHFSSSVVPMEVVEAAAKNGHLLVLQFLLQHDRGRTSRHNHVAMTTQRDEQDVVSFQSIPVPKPSDWSNGGHVVHWGGRSIIDAISKKHFDVAQWLYMHAPHELNSEELRLAIFEALCWGGIDLARFLLPPGRRLVDYADWVHRAEVVEMLLDEGVLRENEALAVASIRRLTEAGRLDLMQRIYRLHSPFRPPRDGAFRWHNDWFNAAMSACREGDLDVVRWLVEHPIGRDLGNSIMFGDGPEYAHWFSAAAQEGHVHILQYLLDQDVADQIETALWQAALNGHLRAVKWLHEHFPYSQTCNYSHWINAAVEHGHLEIVQYFDGRVVVPESWSTNTMDLAAEHGHLHIVQWLSAQRREGCSKRAMDSAAGNGHLKIVQWLHLHRSEGCSTLAMDGAARNGQLDVLKWLRQKRSEGCTQKAVVDAAEHSHVRVVSWLRDHYPGFVPSQPNMVIHPPNQFEMMMFLHEAYPDVFYPENGDRLMLGVVGEANDEHVKTWLHEQYCEKAVVAAKGTGK